MTTREPPRGLAQGNAPRLEVWAQGLPPLSEPRTGEDRQTPDAGLLANLKAERFGLLAKCGHGLRPSAGADQDARPTLAPPSGEECSGAASTFGATCAASFCSSPSAQERAGRHSVVSPSSRDLEGDELRREGDGANRFRFGAHRGPVDTSGAASMPASPARTSTATIAPCRRLAVVRESD